MHSTFSTRNTNEYSEPTILWRNACNWVYTTCTYRRVLWALRKPVLFFIFLRAANKNADAERESGPRPKLTHIFLPTRLSRWLQCDVGEWMAVPVPGPWYDQKCEGKTQGKTATKSHAHVKWLFLYFECHYGWHFFFVSQFGQIGRLCWVLGTQKTTIFVFFFFCFSFRTCCSWRIQIKDSVEYRTECFVFFFVFYLRNLIMLRKTRSAERCL